MTRRQANQTHPSLGTSLPAGSSSRTPYRSLSHICNTYIDIYIQILHTNKYHTYTIRSRYSSTLPPRCWMCSRTPRCLTALRVRYHLQPVVAVCLLDVLNFIVLHCPIVSFSLQLCGWVERRSVQRKRGGLSTPGQRAVSLSRYSGGKFPAIGDRAASELLATELCCQRPLN